MDTDSQAPITTTAADMADVQGSSDARRVAIDKVGVKDVTHPITLHCPVTGGVQHTIATFNMYVGLPHDQKGTHMSRFMEVLNRHHDALRSDQIMAVCRDIRDYLEAEEAHLELEFPYFIHKRAPQTGAPGMVDIGVTFKASCGAVPGEDAFIMGLRVPAMSLCPCSKEISDYGAHSQRCMIEVRVQFAPGKLLWIEQLYEAVECCASAPVYSVLKRPDEKLLTEQAYNNPKFVEDVVRDLAVALDALDELAWYQITSENFESIHNHNAYAFLERDKRRE